jgi:hypothetical protein
VNRLQGGGGHTPSPVAFKFGGAAGTVHMQSPSTHAPKNARTHAPPSQLRLVVIAEVEACSSQRLQKRGRPCRPNRANTAHACTQAESASGRRQATQTHPVRFPSPIPRPQRAVHRPEAWHAPSFRLRSTSNSDRVSSSLCFRVWKKARIRPTTLVRGAAAAAGGCGCGWVCVWAAAAEAFFASACILPAARRPPDDALLLLLLLLDALLLLLDALLLLLDEPLRRCTAAATAPRPRGAEGPAAARAAPTVTGFTVEGPKYAGAAAEGPVTRPGTGGARTAGCGTAGAYPAPSGRSTPAPVTRAMTWTTAADNNKAA